MKIEVEDSENENILKHLPQACQFIDEALAAKETNNVLVHCAAGMSRSGSVCIAYMMFKERGWDFEQAWKEGKAKRDVMYPNPGFCKQLK